ncbi:hypothetical protein Agabi119p4_1611 [Agaricus bisporus var. burnettii]|uniref:Uncharacterized protein n=1 Tax=Agaricus bisporus var. burnettii TaxID=192524 RepID=A0A8H7KJL2_AGABI|nr:hypothetical protein Agabi119p4_1611 [Agaricus bisporus var. burnettii]
MSTNLTTIKILKARRMQLRFDLSGASNALTEHFHFARYINLFMGRPFFASLTLPHPAFLSSPAFASLPALPTQGPEVFTQSGMFRSRPPTGPWICPSIHAPTLSIIKPSITYEISPCPMTSNPPPSPGKDAPHRSMVSPAQAIAEAWKRETLESQERWRKLNEEMKRKYQEARRRYPVSKM